MSCFESWSIIGAVARYRNDVATLLERFDQTFLIERTRTSNDFQFIDTIVHFFIGEGFKLWACDDDTVGVVVAPKSDLTTNLACGGSGVASDDFYINTR